MNDLEILPLTTLSPTASRWLNTHLDQVNHVSAMRVEASNRVFYRVDCRRLNQHQELVFMHSPPTLEANDRFVTLARLFAANNVPVPIITEASLEAGFFLMTDLGRTHLEETYCTPQEQPALRAAIEGLTQLANIVDETAIEAYTEARFRMELGIFSEWFLGAHLGQIDEFQAIADATEPLIDAILAQPLCCVHRDYHCRNLLFESGQLGVVDFQDALRGPVLYDIASLLRDCYHLFDESQIEQYLDFFLTLEHTQPLRDQFDRPTIKRLFDFTAIQRQLKALGIFARLSLRDGKDSHLIHIKPTLKRLIELTASYVELENLNAQLAACTKEQNAT